MYRTTKMFTLIELLIVIAIVLILISLIHPAIRKAIVQAEMVICMNRIKQTSIVAHVYASDHADHMPNNTRSDGYNHTPWVPKTTIDAFQNDYSFKIENLVSPNYEDEGLPWYTESIDSYVVGYSVMFGMPHIRALMDSGVIPEEDIWLPAIKTSDPSDSYMMSDWNENSTASGTWTSMAHHGSGDIEANFLGGIDYAGENPMLHGMAGTHIGYLDGSVVWKDASEMQMYTASHVPGHMYRKWH